MIECVIDYPTPERLRLVTQIGPRSRDYPVGLFRGKQDAEEVAARLRGHGHSAAVEIVPLFTSAAHFAHAAKIQQRLDEMAREARTGNDP